MNSPYPDLSQLRLDAKKLLRAARGDDTTALKHLPRQDRTPRLADAQFAIARSVGFTSWPALIAALGAWEQGRHPVDMRTRILLVRRGDRTPTGRITGHDDGGLNDSGIRQSKKLAEIVTRDLQGEVGAVLSSKRRGSIEMARIIADISGIDLAEPTCDLCEMHPGVAEGLTEQERIVRYGPNSSFVPGAEPWSDFLRRSADSLQRIAASRRGQTIICVTEGATIKVSFVAFGEMSPRVAEGTTVEHASITEWSRLERGDIRRVGTWHLERHNDTRHLRR